MVQGSLRLTVSISWLSKPTTSLLSNQTRKDHPPRPGACCLQHSDLVSSILVPDTVSLDHRELDCDIPSVRRGEETWQWGFPSAF